MPKKRLTKEEKLKQQNKEESEKKLFAFLAVFFSILGFIAALIYRSYAKDAKKDYTYVMFYAKQSLVLFIAWIIVALAALILKPVPVVGNIITGLAWAFVIILWIFAWINALSGKRKTTPIIGHMAKEIRL